MHMRHSSVTLAAAVLVWLAANPLTAQSDPTHGTDATCSAQAAQRPRRTSARDSLQDAIGYEFRTRVRQEVRDAGIENPTGLVILVRRSRDDAFDLRNYQSSVPDSVVERAVNAISARLEAWPWPAPMRMFVRLDSAPLALDGCGAKVRERRPSLVNRQDIAGVLKMMAGEAASGPAASETRQQLQLMMLVARDGSIPYVALERQSPSMRLNKLALAMAARARFRPAFIGDRPVDVWVALPIEVTAR